MLNGGTHPAHLSDFNDALLDGRSHAVPVRFDEAIAKQAVPLDGQVEIVAERDFVVPTGGGYFFSLSVSALRNKGGPKHSKGSPSSSYPL
jgi:hypothetical protein